MGSHTSIASKLGWSAETLRKWLRQSEIDQGKRDGLTSSEQARLKELERENRELKRANTPRAQAKYCARQRLFSPRRSRAADRNNAVVYRREPRRPGGRADLCPVGICQHLPIAPSTYYDHKARVTDPERLPKRIKRDRQLAIEIRRVYAANFRVYSARKVWRQMTRAGIEVARCTVERLMKRLNLQGVRRGAKRRTTISDAAQQRPLDLVNRQFTATRPNQLWVAGITFVATWTGFV